MSTTPLERLIDALQSALLSAQTVDRNAHDLSDESRRLIEAVKRAGLCAHALRASGDQ
jgi:hypothetical protein